MTAHSFTVAIIGAGLGGLAAGIGIARSGHNVTIFERAPALAEIGAGIQVPPNSTRILERWGILEHLQALSDQPGHFHFRSYRDGAILRSVNLVDSSEGLYNHPYLHVHRADYHEVLVREFRRLGGKVQLNSEVIRIDMVTPTIHIKGQPNVLPDLIIAADGVKSFARESLLGRVDPPCPSGDMALRCVITGEAMAGHPDLSDMLQSSDLHYWIGPEQHVVGYKLRAGDLFNIVISTTDTLPDTVDMSPTQAGELLERVKGWDPKLQALIGLAEKGSKGRLMRVNEMESWIHPSSKFVLLGDACHATMPYLAQGAAQAIEDGAVLGHLFEKIRHPSQLPDILVVYENLRKPHATHVVNSATSGRRVLHLPDGPVQQERDRQLREEQPFERFPHPWADPVLRDYMFDFDPLQEVEQAWSRYISGVFPGTTGAWKVAKTDVI